MNVNPPLICTSFDDVAPGRLFIWPLQERRFVALKTQGPKPSDSPRALVLAGPDMDKRGFFTCIPNLKTVLLLPDTCSLELPADGADWQFEPPQFGTRCVLLAAGFPYIHANLSVDGSFENWGWVASRDGSISPNRPDGAGALPQLQGERIRRTAMRLGTWNIRFHNPYFARRSPAVLRANIPVS